MIGAFAIRNLITIDLASSTSCSTASVNHLPQGSTTTPLIQSLTMEYSQQQSTNSVTIVSDTHTTTSVVECLTTSSSLVTSVSGQAITTATGTYVCTYTYMYVCLYIRIYICTSYQYPHKFVHIAFFYIQQNN